MLFPRIKAKVLNRLKALDPELIYHNVAHTLDVLEQSDRIAKEEGVMDMEDLILLKTAAMYHDTGFLSVYRGHEKVSCEIFMEDAGEFGFKSKQKEIITALIMATRIPQQPSGLLQKIICDADLDYLGRDDFFTLGNNLRKEFLHFKIVPDNTGWQELQLNFLRDHHYHTESSQKKREATKQLHYSALLAERPE